MSDLGDAKAPTRFAQLLAADVSPLRDEGVRILVEHALSQPLTAAVDLMAVHDVVLHALDRENLALIVGKHAAPGFRRYAAAVLGTSAQVGDLVSDRARARLHELVRQARQPRSAWTRGMIDPALLRRLLGPVWVQLLLNFARRFPGMSATTTAGPEAKPGLASKLGRSVQLQAGRLVGAGKSVMEGLGIDVEKKLLGAARDFSEGALAVWNQALKERLGSEEGRALIEEIKFGVLEHVLRTKLTDLHLDAQQLPIDALFELAPELIAHAVQTPFVKTVIEGEVRAYLTSEGARPIAELLLELGVLEETRALLLARGAKFVRSLADTSEFAGWLARLYESA
jgi:hypothetical protein